MGAISGITWTDATFNPWIGCTKVSQGCKLCYAETENKRYNWNPAGWGPGAPRKRTSIANWKKPLMWANQALGGAGVKRRVFCASLADVFDHEIPQEWRNDLWRLINECANPEMFDVYGAGLEWLILTKRPENITSMIPDNWRTYPPSWVRIGVTCEDQENADKRIPQLLKVWKGNNFISYEPAIGPLDLIRSTFRPDVWEARGYSSKYFTVQLRGIDWLICGGESGAGCRPMDIRWARNVRDQCAEAGVPFFMKQLGGFPNKRHDPAEWPEDLRIQEFPE